MVDDSVFSRLMSGEIFPGQFFNPSVDDSDWWDDLIDYNQKFAISVVYEKNYGSEFMKAQAVLKAALEQPAM